MLLGQSSTSLHGRLWQVVRERPDAVAVRDDSRALTYARLKQRASALARALHDAGVPPGGLVGLRLPRGVDIAVGIIGILAHGSAYVPIDPHYPEERQTYIEEDARLSTIVEWDEDGGAPRVARTGRTPHAKEEIAEGAAYVIYTSGSTGHPKGVVVGHRQVLAMLDAARPLIAPTPGDVWTLFHSPSFDFSVWELWGALLSGGRLIVVSKERTHDPVRFLDLLRAEGVSVLNQVPTEFGYLVSALEGDPAPLPALRRVFLGGEAVNLETVARWKRTGAAPQARMYNLYGLTETAVVVSSCPLDPPPPSADPGHTPIGRPLPHLRVRLVDDTLKEVPEGEPGELLVSGAGLASGYLNRPETTARRFVTVDGEAAYRTGDWARLYGATLYYLGRRDRQVQLRGHRIELGEIEAALRRHPGVEECAVVDVLSPLGETMLAAHFVAAAENAPSAGELRAFLQEHLPRQMVPALFRRQPTMPISGTGKTDLEALRKMT
ncbi:amino acid adenylation domain-containing protein [Marinactinospora thermotolerans]|uniref:amino acid adenylation domain-containing protein n=1 Tax=Marinactinospora thermotolerans TaxID=531310 RepID=UPI003D8EAEEE